MVCASAQPELDLDPKPANATVVIAYRKTYVPADQAAARSSGRDQAAGRARHTTTAARRVAGVNRDH